MFTRTTKIFAIIILNAFCLTQLSFATPYKAENLRRQARPESGEVTAEAGGDPLVLALSTPLTQAPATGVKMSVDEAMDLMMLRMDETKGGVLIQIGEEGTKGNILFFDTLPWRTEYSTVDKKGERYTTTKRRVDELAINGEVHIIDNVTENWFYVETPAAPGTEEVIARANGAPAAPAQAAGIGLTEDDLASIRSVLEKIGKNDGDDIDVVWLSIEDDPKGRYTWGYAKDWGTKGVLPDVSLPDNLTKWMAEKGLQNIAIKVNTLKYMNPLLYAIRHLDTMRNVHDPIYGTPILKTYPVAGSKENLTTIGIELANPRVDVSLLPSTKALKPTPATPGAEERTAGTTGTPKQPAPAQAAGILDLAKALDELCSFAIHVDRADTTAPHWPSYRSTELRRKYDDLLKRQKMLFANIYQKLYEIYRPEQAQAIPPEYQVKEGDVFIGKGYYRSARVPKFEICTRLYSRPGGFIAVLLRASGKLTYVSAYRDLLRESKFKLANPSSNRELAGLSRLVAEVKVLTNDKKALREEISQFNADATTTAGTTGNQTAQAAGTEALIRSANEWLENKILYYEQSGEFTEWRFSYTPQLKIDTSKRHKLLKVEYKGTQEELVQWLRGDSLPEGATGGEWWLNIYINPREITSPEDLVKKVTESIFLWQKKMSSRNTPLYPDDSWTRTDTTRLLKHILIQQLRTTQNKVAQRKLKEDIASLISVLVVGEAEITEPLKIFLMERFKFTDWDEAKRTGIRIDTTRNAINDRDFDNYDLVILKTWAGYKFGYKLDGELQINEIGAELEKIKQNLVTQVELYFSA